MDKPREMLEDLSALALELHRGAPSRPREAFIDWALEALKRHVHFDSALWAVGHATATGLPVVHTHWLHRQPARLMEDYAAIAPYDTVFIDSLRQPGISIIGDARTVNPEQTAEYLDRYQIEHVLNTCDIDPLSGLLNDIALWRAQRARPFGEDDRRFMQAAFPHLIEACTHNRLSHLASAASPRMRGSWCAAAADRAGVLHVVDDAFPRLLPREWPGWSGPGLPAPLAEAAAAGVARRIAFEHLVCKVIPMDDLVLLQVRECAEIDRLTAREREICAHTAQGLSHKDIARLLGLSPATVRNHLAAACRRLKARNKAQVAALVQGYD